MRWQRRVTRLLRWLAGIAIACAFAYWVWPTRFRYDHMTVDGNLVPVRIDRFSGDADMLVPEQGWTPVEGVDNGTDQPQPATARPS